jgi:predicted nuclease of predicted toxin-antitoxin system
MGLAGLGIPDEEVLALAHADGRAIMTHNRKHFRKLHNAGRPHSGMVLCTEDTDFDSLADRVDQALSQVIDLTGQVIRITRARH